MPPRRRIPFSFLWQGPLRRRLWLGGVAVALFVATLAVANEFTPRDRAITGPSLGMDFIAFYTAGTFVREGRADALYDLDAKRDFQREVARTIGLDIGNAMGPWWNPSVYAWVFVPLSRLDYPTAAATWVAINVGCTLLAIGLLCLHLAPGLPGETPRQLRDASPDQHLPRASPGLIGFLEHWRTWGLVPLLTLVSMPFIGTVSHAQNTGTSLLLLTLVTLAWLAGRATLAGLACGLLFYKPQLGALVAAMLVLSLGWRALLGLAITGTALLAINLLTLPGTLTDYLHRLPENLHKAQDLLPYLWDRHVTLKAFWRLLVQGPTAGAPATVVTALTLVCTLALLEGLAVAWWRSRRTSPERLIAATITAMPLVMPFYFDYDLLLLVVPAVLLARETGATRDRWLVRAWVVLYVWLMVNPHVAGLTRVNGSVLLLSAVASMSIIRACRSRPASVAVATDPPPASYARAAA